MLVATAATMALGACGGSGTATDSSGSASGESDGESDSRDASGAGGEFALVRYSIDPSVTVGADRRLAVGLADLDGTLRVDGPPELTATLLGIDEAPLGAVTGRRRDEAIGVPYYEFRLDVPDSGIYTLRVELDSASQETSFSVAEAGALAFAEPGEQLEPFDTPTVADPGGIDSICTRDPACPFHAVTLTDALAGGTPVVYLIGTPAFCQTGVCGPILDVLIDVAAETPDVAFVHAEVYADSAATVVAPAVEASGLAFEPVVFLADASGVLVERLDVIVDRSELRDRIALLTA